MLNPYLYEARFLDIFAGSGGIGIEALSRGAAFCCFVEQNPQAVSCIRENLIKTRFTENSHILKKDARNIAVSLAKNEPYDIVFMDPPYNKKLEYEVMKNIAGSDIVNSDTLFVIEASIDTDFSWTDEMGLVCVKEKKYKTNKHIFLKFGG